MSFLLSRRNGTNSLVDMRVQLLTSQQKINRDKDCSPTLKDLRETEKNRVKRFSDIFERKAWLLKGKDCNWWLKENGLSPRSAKSSTPKKTSTFIFPPRSAPAKSINVRIDDAIKLQKLLKIESEHVKQLKDMVSSFRENSSRVFGYKEAKIRENLFALHGDLKAIIKLHDEKILIRMKSIVTAKGNCVEFVKFLVKLIDNGYFYCYVNHKMMAKSAKKCQESIAGLFPHSKVDPFKILEVYSDWMTILCNEFKKRPLDSWKEIAVCEEAQKKFTSLFDKIADAENVSRIAQISSAPIHAQFKVYNIIKRDQKIEEITAPMLLLIPNKHFKYGYRYPLDIIQMGKFIKSFEISMLSQEYEYTYDAKCFVFENCVVFTNFQSGGKSFCYENHFWIKDVTFGATAKKDFAKLTNCNHNIIVDNTELLKVLRTLKSMHRNDEVTAEINMQEHDLMKLIDSLGNVMMNWRRNSFMQC